MPYLLKHHPALTYTVVSAVLTLIVIAFDIAYDQSPWNLFFFFPAYFMAAPFAFIAGLLPDGFDDEVKYVITYGLSLAIALGMDMGWRSLWKNRR